MENEKKTMWQVFCAVLLVGLLLQGVTGLLGTPNPYNTYALQARRWIEGHLDLGQSYAHLEIAEYGGKFYASFPPFPSVVLLPFVLLFGTNTPDGLISLLFAAAGAAYAARLAFLYGKKEKEAFFWALYITVGSNLLSLMCTGWVWFIAQTMAHALVLAALCMAKEGKTGTSLLLLACAVGCRPFTALCLPLLLYLLHGAGCRLSKKTVLRLLPAAAVCCFYALLNVLRFGNPLEFGHNYLPEFVAEPQFALSYIPDNLKTLVRLPALKEGKLLFPDFNGFNIFLASPLFLSCAARLVRQKPGRAELLTVGLLLLWLLLLCTHRTMGGWHFGHRYTVELLPPALWLCLQKEGTYAGHIPLFLLGFALHIYGFVQLLL
ncbi:MAG: hypothetical protein E7408_05690 [Ruminococcaceae bacterium]|nr:hypothetical protein [Oscillospiraceae bacterium]